MTDTAVRPTKTNVRQRRPPSAEVESPIIARMRDEQYYALANLVKRPMRRWWARVGSWWLVGLGVLLIAQAVQVGIEIEAMQSGSFFVRGDITRQDWFRLIRILSNTSLVLSVGVAFLSATRVFSLIDQTTQDTLAFSKPTLRVYKYKLALLNCWPALIPIFLRVVMYHHWMLARQFDESYSVWLRVMHSLETALPFFILVIWLVAILVVAKGSHWQVWAILLCSQVPFILVMLNVSAIFSPLDSKIFPPLIRFGFSDLGEAVIRWLGLITIYSLFYLLLVGKRNLSAILCFIYCIFLLIPNSLEFYNIYGISNLQFAGMLTESCTQPIAASYSPHTTKLYIFAGILNWEFPAGPAWAVVPVLNGFFWLLAHYFSFSWLMGRKARNPKTQG